MNLGKMARLNNNAGLLLDNDYELWQLLLNNSAKLSMFGTMMKKLILTLALMAASPAGASCYADYKAKQDNPLRLHYGVIELPDTACTKQNANGQIAQRIGVDGWQLLNILSIFAADGLEERKDSAGKYFLRY